MSCHQFGIPIKKILSVSSEDPVYVSKNLAYPSNGSKWLCSAENRTGKCEVVLELSKKVRINHVDVGNCGSAFIEISVGNIGPENTCTEFVTLLSQSMLMTLSDCKSGRNKSKTVSYQKNRFSAAAVEQKWGCLKIMCHQPYNPTEQFGLSFIGVHSGYNGPQRQSSHPVALPTPPAAAKLSPIQNYNKKTSNKPAADKSATHQVKETDGCKQPHSELFQRRKLLKQELPKGKQDTDFLSTYQQNSDAKELHSAVRKMSSCDGKCEIGEEPFKKWHSKERVHKRKSRTKHESGKWLCKKRKLTQNLPSMCKLTEVFCGKSHRILVQEDSVPQDCIEIQDNSPSNESMERHIKDAATQELKPQDVHVEATAQQLDTEIGSATTQPQERECPICCNLFPAYAIELHASSCGEQ